MMPDKKIWTLDFFSLNMLQANNFNLEVNFIEHNLELLDIINKSVIVIKNDDNAAFLVSYYQIPSTRILRKSNIKVNPGDEMLIMSKGGFYYVRVVSGNYDIIRENINQNIGETIMDVKILEFEIVGGVIDPTPELYEKVYQAANEIFSKEGWNNLWVLSGRGPVWLYSALTHIAHPTAGLAIYEPRMNKAIIVSRHRKDIPSEFSIIDIPENAKKVMMRVV